MVSIHVFVRHGKVAGLRMSIELEKWHAQNCPRRKEARSGSIPREFNHILDVLNSRSYRNIAEFSRKYSGFLASLSGIVDPTLRVGGPAASFFTLPDACPHAERGVYSVLSTSMLTRPNTRITGKSGVIARISCQLWSEIFRCVAPIPPRPKVASRARHSPSTQTSAHM